jgi:hypothetical protein
VVKTLVHSAVAVSVHSMVDDSLVGVPVKSTPRTEGVVREVALVVVDSVQVVVAVIVGLGPGWLPIVAVSVSVSVKTWVASTPETEGTRVDLV